MVEIESLGRLWLVVLLRASRHVFTVHGLGAVFILSTSIHTDTVSNECQHCTETLHMGLVPDLLTSEEAARVLRIGRTKAYAMGQEWRVTEGRSGIKVREFGGQLRVPRVWIEEQLGAPLRSIPQRPGRANATHDGGGAPTVGRATEPASTPKPEPEELELLPTTPPAKRTPPATAKPRRAKRRAKAIANANQLTLPFD